MQTPPAHKTRFNARFAIAVHEVAYDKKPRRVEVGLMEMRALEEAGAKRVDGQPLMIDGVPVAVGSLEDRVKAVR